VLIPGQTAHTSQAVAESEVISANLFGNFPFQEAAPIHQITVRYNASNPAAYTNSIRSAIVAFNRVVGSKASITSAAQSNHGALSGLLNDDHPQYALSTGTTRAEISASTPTTGHSLRWTGTRFEPSAVTKSDVGLGNVDNTADSTKSVASAAALTTARTINGTSFNGTAAITTASWGTARTLTLGATGKSVNGSADVTWTLDEIDVHSKAHVNALEARIAALENIITNGTVGWDGKLLVR
jgi:hypothetical protein